MAHGTSRSEVVALYQLGMSGPEIGKRFSISSTAVYNHLRKAGIGRRERAEAAKRSSNQPYLRIGRKWAHRAIWEEAHGPIPSGYHVHHKDGNRHNNSLKNLELVRANEHGQMHGKQGGRPPKCNDSPPRALYEVRTSMVKRITVTHHVFATGGTEAISLVLSGKGERTRRAEDKIIEGPTFKAKLDKGKGAES